MSNATNIPAGVTLQPGDTVYFKMGEVAADDKMLALSWVIGLVLVLFLLKNIFNYLAMYFITFLRNGVLKDLRNALYEKIVTLPVSFYTEKRKGDVIARISSDVLEIQHSFLSILELIVEFFPHFELQVFFFEDHEGDEEWSRVYSPV